MQEFHYVYSITYTDEPNIYYGVRTSRCLPEKDKYWGTPVTFKVWMDAHKATRIKTVLATYPTREEAELAEDGLIEKQWVENKPISLNACINGTKFNSLGRTPTEETRRKQSESHIGQPGYWKGKKRPIDTCKKLSVAHKGRKTGRSPSPEHVQKLIDRVVRTYVGISPEGEHIIFTNAKKFCEDNPELELNYKNVCKCARGNSVYYKKWRFFYQEDYIAMKGVIPPAVYSKPRILATSPTNEEITFARITDFCRDNPEWNFNSRTISACVRGLHKHHKGWRFSYIYDSIAS